nr:hypothetical protein K924_0029 [Actinoplanes sp. N902-109]
MGFTVPVRNGPVLHEVLMDEAHDFEPHASFREGRPERDDVLLLYRFSSRLGEWTCRLDTLNVAYGPATADVFTGDPTRHVDERGLLR